MKKYIEVEHLKKSVEGLQNCYNGFSDTYDKACIIGLIDEEPIADVVPVVHGHWIQEGEPPMFSLTCSVCGQKFFNHYLLPHANYCSMCGAKMDEVTE